MPIKVKPFDPFLAFVNARATHLASFAVEDYVALRPALKHVLFWPEMANEALGLELHLKCLHAVRGRFEEGHSIKILFDKLDASDKAEIEARMAGLIAINPHYRDVQSRGTRIDLDSILVRADEMFNRARYWHEGIFPLADAADHIGDAGMAPMSDAIFDLLLSIHPEWWDGLKRFRIAALDDDTQPTVPVHSRQEPGGDIPWFHTVDTQSLVLHPPLDSDSQTSQTGQS